MNQVNLTGRLTKEPELRKTPSGVSMCKFTLAVNGLKKEDVNFISCIAFNQSADFLGMYAKKGNRIGVTGRIQTGSYDRDGQKVYTTDVVCDRIELLENKPQNQPTNQPQRQPFTDDDFSITSDELPF